MNDNSKQQNERKTARREFLKTSATVMAAGALNLMPEASQRTALAKKPNEGPRGYHAALTGAYRVDPHWPRRPANVNWGGMPGVVLDKNGLVWISTRANPPIQVYDADGKFIKAWGEKSINIDYVHYIKIDHDGNVWLADCGNHVVMKFTPDGKLLEMLGTFGKPGNDKHHFNMPTDMAITPDGDIFVSDGYGNQRIVHFDKNRKFVRQWGGPGTRPGQFALPHAIVMDSSGKLYVADRSNVRVQVFNQKGDLLDVWFDLLVPWGLAVTKNDDIWVCGSSPMRLRENDTCFGIPPKDQLAMKFNTSGKLLQLVTFPLGKDGKEKTGELNWVHGIALDGKDNIYAGDIAGKRAQKFIRQS